MMSRSEIVVYKPNLEADFFCFFYHFTFSTATTPAYEKVSQEKKLPLLAKNDIYFAYGLRRRYMY